MRQLTLPTCLEVLKNDFAPPARQAKATLLARLAGTAFRDPALLLP